MKAKLFLLLAMSISAPVSAEQGCPAGLFPGAGGCAPPPSGAPTSWSLGSPVPTVRWSSRWGAEAIDQTVGRVGTSVLMKSKRKAEKAALLDCQSKGGAKCKISLAYHDHCAVVAWGDTYLSLLGAKTIEEAAGVALTECEQHTDNCRVYYSDCSYPERIW